MTAIISNGHSPRIRSEIDPRLSRSLEYGVAILECFTAERPTLRISELSDMIEVGRSTTHRYAMTLAALGYLEQDDKRRYRLAQRAASSGISAIATIRLETPARSILEELRDRTGHTVTMGALDGKRALYTHRLYGHQQGQYEADLELGVGAHVPLHCTALGKALLAGLDPAELSRTVASLTLARFGPNSIATKRGLIGEVEQVLGDGLAICDEELARDVRSIAAPITVEAAQRPLAIEVTVPAFAYTTQQLLEDLGPSIKQAAARLGATSDRHSYD